MSRQTSTMMKTSLLAISLCWWVLPYWVSAGLPEENNNYDLSRTVAGSDDHIIPSVDRTTAEVDLQGRHIVIPSSGTTSVPQEHSLVQWIHSLKGGYVSDKLVVTSSSIVAAQPIARNETLMIIPSKAIVDVVEDANGFDDRYIEGELFSKEDQSVCHTTISLLDQYRRRGMLPKTTATTFTSHDDEEDESRDIGPYLQFLYEQVPTEALPSYWSDEGKKLMQTIVGKELAPRNFGSNESFVESCDWHIDEHPNQDEIRHKWNKELQHTWSILRSRMVEGKLIPLVDMIQHGQGAKQNVQYSFVDADNSIRVEAGQDLVAGDVLTVSKLECSVGNSEKCMSISDLLSTHGTLDLDYPHRWIFDTGYTNDFLTFVVASGQNSSNSPRIHFSPKMPEFNTQNWMQGHLRKLKRISPNVSQALLKIESTDEREIIQDYYAMLVHDLEMAYVASRESPAMRDSSTLDVDSKKKRHYDALETKPDKLQYEFDIPLQCELEYSNLHHIDRRESFYQQLEFHHHYYEEIGKRDTCLFLDSYPQSCTNYRAHYHEIFVHYAASFLDNVKRVLFVGGGDLMLLHEILKYSEIEIVFGLELDQGVVRESFRNFGIEPEFDNPKVRWIFGDATVILQLIPHEFFGTFDLVLIDLQTYVADTVKVSRDMSIMDFGMQLLKPEGVLSQNHCHAPTRESSFANYAVDLVFEDIPGHCMEYLTVASNGINFLEKKPQDHNIFPLLFYEPVNTKYYSAWNHFHNNRRNNAEGMQSHFETTGRGILTIVEAENVNLPPFPALISNLKQALAKSGLKTLEVEVPPESEQGTEDVNVVLFLLREGFIVLRTWPDLAYCGFDILLWSSHDKRYEAVANLVHGVGGSMENTTSTFEMITGGMSLPDSTTSKIDQETPKQSTFRSDAKEKESLTVRQGLNDFLRIFDLVSPGTNALWIVICGLSSASCHASTAFQDHSNRQVVPIEACDGLTNSTESLVICEESVFSFLRLNVRDRGKIEGIIIDPHAPQEMGQILHKISNSTHQRQELFGEALVILAPTPASPKGTWRDNLLERFRTEMISFNPVYHIHSSVQAPEAHPWFLEILSFGDSMFYSRLIDLSNKLNESSNLTFSIDSGRAGAFSYPPDPTYPSMATNEDFDVTRSRAHFLDQESVGFQEFIQLQLPLKRTVLHPGDNVLANTMIHFWVGRWFDAVVIRQESEEEYLLKLESGEDVIIERKHLLKKLEQNSANNLANGERVLMHFSNFTKYTPRNLLTHIEMEKEEFEGIWRQGYILGQHPNGTSYDVRIMDLQFNDEYVVDRTDLIPQYEAFDPLEDDEALSSETIFSILSDAVQELELPNPIFSTFQVPDAGQIIAASTDDCEIYAIWDGKSRVDLNIYSYWTEVEDVGMELLEFFVSQTNLEATAFDKFPRGIGRVLTDPTDPFWFGQFL